MYFRAILLLAIALFAYGEEPVDYSKYQIVRILPKTLSDLELLNKIREDFDADFWNHPMEDMRPVLTAVGPKNIEILKAFNNSNIKYEIHVNNFQKAIEAERQENDRAKARLGTKAFAYEGAYNEYADILAEAQRLGSDSRVTYLSLGNTYQNRAIPALRISGGSGRKIIILECGIHAREWVTPATCFWITNQLLNVDSTLLSKFDFLVIPTLNPDGYVYTWTNDRLWRKTRSLRSGSTCYGADPNRNWDASWGSAGASNNPCSETYYGISAFSEVENQALRNWANTNKASIGAYFSIHSYSQLWMYPFGYKTANPSNNAELLRLSNLAAAAIRASSGGLTFSTGTIANTIYVASGSSTDWFYENLGIPIAFALELRDKGSYGFQLPASQIKAAADETWNGIQAVLNAI